MKEITHEATPPCESASKGFLGGSLRGRLCQELQAEEVDVLEVTCSTDLARPKRPPRNPTPGPGPQARANGRGQGPPARKKGGGPTARKRRQGGGAAPGREKPDGGRAPQKQGREQAPPGKTAT